MYMRISDKQVNQVLKAYADQVRRHQENKAAQQVDDKGHEIKLSAASQEFMATMQALKNTPEVDEERVQALRQQIEAGTYQLDSQQIARKMLSRSLVDRLV